MNLYFLVHWFVGSDGDWTINSFTLERCLIGKISS